ncbi:MAG: hypothetical protein KAX05_11215, partial [Bacteroidales bacterium]|nr:hypothetical protein [Bacteroidales bacterium]
EVLNVKLEPTPKSHFFATAPKVFGAKTQNPTKVIDWHSLFCEILCFGVFVAFFNFLLFGVDSNFKLETHPQNFKPALSI